VASRPHDERATWLRRAALAAFALYAAFAVFDAATRIRPPDLAPPRPEEIEHDGAVTRVGPASLARRGGVWVVQLAGDPVALGYRRGRLETPLMATGDQRMLDLFAAMVPARPLRALLTLVVRARYRGLDRAFAPARRAELFGEGVGYADRFDWFLPTYHRLVYLHAFYDIALAFEHSPLLGCTAFVAAGEATRRGATPGHVIVGRNFDFDADPWFDDDKVVEIVAPPDRIPFASVSWPGMSGVVTGMNAAGIWVSVNGGRAGTPDPSGVPVPFTTRAVLEEARSIDDALAVIRRDAPMASHILLLADGKSGESAVVERAPGKPLGIVRSTTTTVLANHYRTAPLRDDPADARVRDTTSTLAREARMRELLARQRDRVDPRTAAMILRDRGGVGDRPLPLGNRNAVDALVATHSVIADLTARRLWVSAGPHVLGGYVQIDLAARLSEGAAAADEEAAGDLAADPILADGTYERYRLGGRLRREATALAAAGRLDAAADVYRRAIALRADDHRAWRGLAAVAERRGDGQEARADWARVVALAPESPAALREAEEHAGASR
jgi:isopenicillin-N N-acyltransferase like protein